MMINKHKISDDIEQNITNGLSIIMGSTYLSKTNNIPTLDKVNNSTRKPVKRGAISKYSKESKRRFRNKLITLDLDIIQKENVKAIDLTYPDKFPNNGKSVTRQVTNFFKRLERFGNNYGGLAIMWILEFQERGAPHYHLIVISKEPIPLSKIRTFTAQKWNSIVSKWIINDTDYSKDVKDSLISEHLEAGTRVSKVRKNFEALYRYTFFSKDKKPGNEKGYEQIRPKEFDNIGRWWGIRGKKTGILQFTGKKKKRRLSHAKREAIHKEIILFNEQKLEIRYSSRKNKALKS